jgi:endonuclease YncB( thermonuclease family)
MADEMRWRNVTYEWAAVAFLLAILLAIQLYKPEWTEVVVNPSPRQVQTYEAIDGDSFKAKAIEIRLFGIDAPEYRQSCRDANQREQPCGKLARDALSKLIRSRTVKCSTMDQDRYGRQVSVCKNGALDINQEIVRLGWAIAYRKHSRSYVKAENEARLSKRGIWAWQFEAPESYRRKNDRDSLL